MAKEANSVVYICIVSLLCGGGIIIVIGALLALELLRKLFP